MGDSIIRKTDDLVELILDKRAASIQFIKVQTSPDLITWTTRKTILAKSSPPVDSTTYATWRGKVFDRFVPSVYSLTVPFFLRFRNVTGGFGDAPMVDGDISDVYVAHEASRGSNHFYVFEGTAPQGAAFVNSTKINIPAARDFSIKNTDGASALSIAFNDSGAEVEVATGATYSIGPSVRVTRIRVRGVGGDADFEIRLATEY